MGRARKQEEVKEGLPMWMGTFSDLVTLMMAFFVMLVAMANFEDTSRVEAVIESIHDALGVDGFDRKLVASSKEQAFTPDVRRDDAIQPVIAKLRQGLAKHVSDDFVSMTEREQELRMRLDGGVFFQPGSSQLHPAALALLADLSKELAPVPVNIRVEGFADGSGTEQANWALSSERAVAVVLALREKGPIEGSRLEAVAHGAFQPSAMASESADWSRRVEIVLQTNDMSGARAAGRWME